MVLSKKHRRKARQTPQSIRIAMAISTTIQTFVVETLMPKVTQARRKSFSIYGVASFLLLALVGGAAVFATVEPARAASLTSQIDTELAAFLVPIGLLALVMMMEVTRFAFTRKLPGTGDAAARPIRAWAPATARR
jgi:uncharacterized membrane-anchored protein